MEARSGLSRSTISRIWRAFALQPHRTETFKLSASADHYILGIHLSAIGQPSTVRYNGSKDAVGG